MQFTILSQPRKNLLSRITRFSFAIPALEGFGVLIGLLALPIDPDTKTVFLYSTTRLALIAMAVFGIIGFLYLFWNCLRNGHWQKTIGQVLAKKSTIIPNLLLGIFWTIFLIIGFIILVKPDWILGLNEDKMTRLSFFLIWISLIIIQFIITWFVLWVKIQLSITPHTLEYGAMVVLFLTSFATRAAITNYGLPYQNVWDEVVTYPQAMNMLVEPGLKPYADVPGYGKAAYGDLLTYITAGGEVIGFLSGMRSQEVESLNQFVSPPVGVNSIFAAVHTSGIPLQSPRLLLAFINSAAPVIIYLIARKSLNIDAWSSFGAGLIFSLLSREVIYYSSYILPDALSATLFIALLFASFASINADKNNPGSFLICGILTGLILSVTIRVIAVAIIPFIVLGLARNHTRMITKFCLIILGMIAAFLISSPYAFLDFPGYLNKITGLTWYQDLSWTNRLSGIVFYLQGMFQPGFNSSYIDSNTGSIGLGPIVAFLALLGGVKLIRSHPRQVILMLIFSIVHLYLISSIVHRYTRHALVLYPIACIFAGGGLLFLVDGFENILKHLSSNKVMKRWLIDRNGIWGRKINAPIILIVFLLLATPQINLTLRYIQRTHNYQTSQEKVMEFLVDNLRSGDKVGILDILPWVEQDLDEHNIPFERFTVNDTLDTLKLRGITVIVSSNRFKGQYASYNESILTDAFSSQTDKMTEFNNSSLEYDGYPAGSLYMFVARVH